MTSEEDHHVAVIDTASTEVMKTFKVGLRPRTAAFSADGRLAYVPGENDATLTLVDARRHEPLKSIKLAGENVRPMAVALSPDNARAYVSTGRGGTVNILDAHSLGHIGSVRVGQRPWGIALSPDGRYLYTANGPSNDVSIVDTKTMQVVKTVAAGERPWGVVAAATSPNARSAAPSVRSSVR
jgi:YVTN family beta-propeller protein